MECHPSRFREIGHVLTTNKLQGILQELQVQRRDMTDPLLALSVLRQDGSADFLRDYEPISTNLNFCLAGGQEFLPGRGHSATFDEMQILICKKKAQQG